MDNHASMPTESQQYQQQQYYQQPEDATNPNTAYDPSTQAYYASYQHYNQAPHQQAQPDFPSYYYPDYSNSYQAHPHVDPNSIHPPGVVIPAETPQPLVQNHPDVYYSHGFANPQQQLPQNGYMAAPSYSTFAARGGHGERSIRGGRHGSSRGRGKGRGGRGGPQGTASVNYVAPRVPRQGPQPSSSIPGQPTRCEVCRVDCNTPEVLEQHKNGKKHKKYLKVYEELQIAKSQVGLQNPPAQVPDSNAVPGNNNGGVDTAMSSVAQTPEEREQTGATRSGLKRKVKGVRGGKLMKSSDGSRKPPQSSKPTKAVDLFCSLCSVKCESQVVYNSHMIGKKHLTNVKKFQGHEAPAMGTSGLQALYPPFPETPSTLQALYPPTANAPCAPYPTHDSQHVFEPNKAIASTSLAYDQQVAVQDAQAKLVQILNQHGVQDAHGLLSQMIPVLLTLALPNGATPNVTGLATQDQQNSVVHVSSGENESKPEQVVSESVQKTELSEAVADKPSMEGLENQAEVAEQPTTDASISTEQATADGRENELVAG